VVLNCFGSGIFVEMGFGPCLVDTNLVAFTRAGEGIYLHDASGVTLAHNLLALNAHFGIYGRVVTERECESGPGSSQLVGASDLRILSNLFIDNYRGAICLPLPGERCQRNTSDFNLFLSGTQWQWEGPTDELFWISRNDGRIPIDTLREALSQVPSQQPVSAERPAMSLRTWQQTFGWDLHSSSEVASRGKVVDGALEAGSIQVSALGRYLEAKSAERLASLRVPPLPGVGSDLYGNRLAGPDGLVPPGPFAASVGRTRWTFWPLP
jgi:hypothetical protein